MRQHILLLEMHNLRQMLLEDRLDFLKKNYLPRCVAFVKSGEGLTPDAIRGATINVTRDTPEQAGEKLFNYIISFDPDGTKAFSQWILNLVLRNPKKDPMPLEDLSRAKDYLTRFIQMKKEKTIPRETDISRIKSLGDLFQLVKQGSDNAVAATDAEKQKAFAESQVILNDDTWLVVSPKTVYAACYFGRDTEWCTAYGGEGTRYPSRTGNMFQTYAKDGPIYTLFNKQDEQRYQFHFESRQFMDVDDRRIDTAKFLAAYPEIDRLFNGDRDGANVIAEIAGYKVIRTDAGLEFSTSMNKFEPAQNSRPFTINLEGQGIVNVPVRVIHICDETNANRWGSRNEVSIVNPIQKSAVRDQIRALFEKLGLKPAEHADPVVIKTLASLDMWWDAEHGQWATSEHIGQREMRLRDGMEVMRLPFSDEFGDEEGNRHYFNVVKDGQSKGRLWATQQTLSFHGNMFPGGDVADIILHFKPTHDVEFTLKSLNDADLKRVMDKLPHLGTVADAYRAFGGDDERFERRLDQYCDENSIDHPTIVAENKVLIETFNNVEDLVAQHGTDSAEWFMQIQSGEKHLDIDEGDYHKLDDYLDMLKKIKSPLIAKIGAYLAQEYPDEIENLFDEDSPFDPNSTDDIEALNEEVDDDNLNSAMQQGNRWGYETGANSEVHKIIEKAISDNPYVYHKDGHQWKQGEFKWDVEMAIIAPLDEWLELISEYPSDAGNFIEAKEAKISMQEPHYGFTDFDDGSSLEGFVQGLDDFL